MSNTNNFFTVFLESQTYKNILYLLLSFPLGIFYFVFLVTGLSVGFSLLIVWIGIPILLFTIFCWWKFLVFEKYLAENLLEIEVPEINHTSICQSHWDKLKGHLSNSTTWKGLLYLFIKFPMGIISFVLVVVLLSVSLSLIASTFAIQHMIKYMYMPFLYDMTTIAASFVVFFLGFILLIVSLHILNGMAYLSGKLVKSLFTKCDCKFCQKVRKTRNIKIKRPKKAIVKTSKQKTKVKPLAKKKAKKVKKVSKK